MLLIKPGVPKLRPAGKIRPAKPFHPAAKTFFNNEKILYLQKLGWFGRMWYIPKQSHYVKMSDPRTVV